MSFLLPEQYRRAAEAAKGFMPPAEGEALAAAAAAYAPVGPIVEIGTYCGKSTIYLAAAAERAGQLVITVDHHRGSEENQPGWEYHDPSLVDPAVGLLDTLPSFRSTLAPTGLEDHVIAIVGKSARVAQLWRQPLGMLFLDGGHTDAAATADYEGWAPRIVRGGGLAIHDVFPNPADGGRPPYNIYLRAMASGAFKEVSVTGSLRVLERVADGIG
jgi:MMP 1-O-methyltransferase